MPIMKNLFFVLLLLSAGIIISSCNNQSKSTSESEKIEAVEKSGTEYTSAYVCPMHCKGSGSEEAGSCPVCNMDYVANADHKSDGHMHDEESNHDGHNH
ncbi:MAG: hypothetical protein KJP00_15595 [Bacteroidia bacterium]|nr:hypothetical protein [Bacteroidia bacterium]